MTIRICAWCLRAGVITTVGHYNEREMIDSGGMCEQCCYDLTHSNLITHENMLQSASRRGQYANRRTIQRSLTNV